jgi:hypothetical protein
MPYQENLSAGVIVLPPNGLDAQLRGTGRRRLLRRPRLMPGCYQTSIGTRCAT